MLRKLIETDLPEVLVVEHLTQPAPWTQDIFVRCFKAGYKGWVIEQDNQVIAFIIFSCFGEEGHILNVCVHPDYQRSGLGRKLVEYVLAYAKQREVKFILLEVRRSNYPAIHLYHQLGFSQIGERPNYYPTEGGREDALVFAKDLESELSL